jgi:hypothetical protein
MENTWGGGENDFSLEEKVVGEWIDGKPLYQKTYDFGALPSSNYKEIPTGLTNVIVRSIQGYTYSSTSGLLLTVPSLSNTKASYQLGMSVRENASVIRVHPGDDFINPSAYKECYITLQYTKTTD